MELAHAWARGAIRLGGRTPGPGLPSDRHQAARAELDRMPLTGSTAGARDDERGRSRGTKALPRR